MTRLDDLKAQLAQLDEMIQGGVLQGDAARTRRADLEAQILAALASPAMPEASPEAAPRPSGKLLAGIVAFVLAVGVGGYAWLGNPAGLSVKPGDGAAAAAATQGGQGQGVTADQIEQMVQRLAERLKTTPDDAEGWTMLARSYAMLDRHAEAVKAYAELARLKPKDAQTWADYADAMGAANGMNLQGEPEKMIERALALDPANIKALALSGTVAFAHGDARKAARQWEQAWAGVPADSDIGRQLKSALDEARSKAGLPPLPSPPAASSAAAPASGG